ncbi:MAG TPA: sigma factor-like helix-turn-helix DNA-binding protein, partial [Candidatus Polarisedimenticolaceae bacterium]
RGRPATPEQSLLDREKCLRLAAVVGELSERQREVFLLRVGLGATVEETAATLRCSEAAVRTALHEATREIRERMARGLGRGELHERR